ncbi:MAG: 4Fe-4S dicluster domain-containing protein [Anaerolineales bacterium]|nr:4Fe-4S dicluster domain-containing protein [Anaerolineales bacterium]
MPQTKYIIDDNTWEELIELTNGAAAVCFQCGVCTAVCPWGLVKEETLSVRSYMRAAQLGLQKNGNENLWLCTTCAQCEAYCPRGVDIADVFRGLRYLAWKNNHPHEGLPSLLWSVYWNNNPWEQPPSQRTNWAKNLDLPIFDPEEHEILYYVGCTASYDTRAQKVAHAVVSLLNAAGVPFGTLGEDEPCSGEEVLSVGHKHYFREMADNATKAFKEGGITQIVTTDPHSYDAFKNHYGNAIQPFHYTQYLANLIEEGRLTLPAPRSPLPAKVTFHDPCYLSRHNDEIEAPRKVLNAIPGVELVEMPNIAEDTLCCGGGGGRMWLETEPGERFSDLRVEEALSTGAQLLATSCPYCIACLEDSVKAQGITELVVMDVAEIAALAIKQ